MSKSLTRLELYNLVWSHPLKSLAGKFGVRPVQLGKTCDAYDIPRPPAGYWQKLEYGKPVDRPPLTTSLFLALEPVSFEGRNHSTGDECYSRQSREREHDVHIRNL
ncbi:hypothetical protein [Rhizobium sp. SYY.PMSO]|uniref:hypothetical protein n=1 Tax=Rhizobium sp. SYY.PMSO TaxID=3382192 RepID=UPI00398FB831